MALRTALSAKVEVPGFKSILRDETDGLASSVDDAERRIIRRARKVK